MSDKPTDSDTPAPAGVEPKATGAPNLDSLLAEFDQNAAAGKPEKVARLDPDRAKKLDTVFNYVESKRVEELKADEVKTVKQAISTIKSDETLKELPDGVIEGLLYKYAGEDREGFQQAYLNRHSKPDAWATALKTAQKWATADLKGATVVADKDRVASDVLAARASIAGESATKAPAPEVSPVKLVRMSDRDWNGYLQEQYAAARG